MHLMCCFVKNLNSLKFILCVPCIPLGIHRRNRNISLHFPILIESKSVFVSLWVIDYFTTPPTPDKTSEVSCYSIAVFYGKCPDELHSLVRPVLTFSSRGFSFCVSCFVPSVFLCTGWSVL